MAGDDFAPKSSNRSLIELLAAGILAVVVIVAVVLSVVILVKINDANNACASLLSIVVTSVIW